MTGVESSVLERYEEAIKHIPQGYEPVEPADLRGSFDKNGLTEASYQHDVAWYMGKDIELILRSNAIYSCYGWQSSKGCQVERYTAGIYGLELFEETKTVQALSIFDFQEECKKNSWDDSNVENLKNLAFISIITTPDVQKYHLEEDEEHWFKEDHSNVLNLEFDDCNKDREWEGHKAYTISEEQAKKIVEFIEKNLGRNFLIHCRAGISRSGAVAKFISMNYHGYNLVNDFTRPNQEVLRKLDRILWERHYDETKE